jgi:predicted glycoside hydrolase/deacetylase ChbG (UPF0249 family)
LIPDVDIDNSHGKLFTVESGFRKTISIPKFTCFSTQLRKRNRSRAFYTQMPGYQPGAAGFQKTGGSRISKSSPLGSRSSQNPWLKKNSWRRGVTPDETIFKSKKVEISSRDLCPVQKKLIVNADDYGYTQGVSAGIRASHLQGIVTSTTAMMNMPGVEKALEQAMQECPTLGLGVHLVLTTGTPRLPASDLRSVVADRQDFPEINELIHRLLHVNWIEAKAEWRAQIERFVSATGRVPDHLDSHHHISFLSPLLFRAMLELAEAYGCAIRFPSGEAAADMESDFSLKLTRECLESHHRLMERYQPRHPDTFSMSYYGENVTGKALRGILSHLPDGSTEIMCHPGYVDEELTSSSVYRHQRERELAVLTDSGIREFVKEQEIALINFGDL